jgi:signal transduction histidine kinase
MSTDSIAGRSTSDIGEEGDPSTGNTERALRLLSEASATLGASLELETTIDRVARVIVRTLADWCVADLLEIEVGPVPVHETLAALEPLVGPQVRAKRLEYRYEPCTTDITMEADSEKIRQILLNLLSNAIKFTEPGGQLGVSCTVEPEHR